MQAVGKYPQALARVGDAAVAPFVFVLFFISGFAALLYQVIWQRVLAIFSGADVYSITIIVAAFMAGLGCGSLAGGYIADKVSVGKRIALFAAAEIAIALFASISTWLYYDVLYQQHSYLAGSPIILAGVLFASLLWPTFFMGMSLPLLSKTLTQSIERAASMVGALYGFNTLGAAVGAFATTWFFIRSLGFEATILVGAALNIFAALGAIAVAPYFLGKRGDDEADTKSIESQESVEEREGQEAAGSQPIPTFTSTSTPMFPVWVWLCIYGLSGFVALSLEIVWFRLLGVMLKSNAFTFGNLLAIFLGGLAFGTFRGIEWAKKSKRPARIFFGLQAGVTIYAALSLIVFLAAVNTLPAMKPVWDYFGGYNTLDIGESLGALRQFTFGPYEFSPQVEESALDFLILYLALPLLLIGPPTVMMGMSFPFLQKVVQRDVLHLGRRVGWLQTANIFGSMLGAVLTGWVFLRFLGTSTTLKLLLILGGIFLALCIYALFSRSQSRHIIATGALAPLLVALWLIPDSSVLWAKLHGTTPSKIIAAEDGSGLSVLKSEMDDFSGATTVYANGLGQSVLPFPGHHTTLGLLPAMLHPNPEKIAIIGLGSGATLHGAGGREETREITCIEIVAPQLATLQEHEKRRSYGGLQTLLGDRRINYTFTDGRSVIMLGGKEYDIIEADALRPTSAYAGNLYSYEYFTLLRERLAPGGYAVTWSPTPRTLHTFVKAFPHVLIYDADINLLIGSNEPIEWDVEDIRQRLTSNFARAYYSSAGIDVEQSLSVIEKVKPIIIEPGDRRLPLDNLNRDLFPRDEYLIP